MPVLTSKFSFMHFQPQSSSNLSTWSLYSLPCVVISATTFWSFLHIYCFFFFAYPVKAPKFSLLLILLFNFEHVLFDISINANYSSYINLCLLQSKHHLLSELSLFSILTEWCTLWRVCIVLGSFGDRHVLFWFSLMKKTI